MPWSKNIQHVVVTAMLAIGVAVAPLTAQAAKDIDVLPANNPQSLHIDINAYTVQVGSNVEFSFSSDRDGYVSLWDIGTSGRVTKIFPNKYSTNGRIYAGRKYGAGGQNDTFAFRVGGPVGMEDVYLVWTATPGEQPKQFSYPSAKNLARDLQVVERMPENTWATAKTTFEIVDGQAPRVTVAPPSNSVHVNGNVYILAMGANVEPLTKTNQDARNFVRGMQSLFNVPGSNIRMIENAYKKDFKNGINWLRQSAHQGDLVLIFFSGHGSTVKDDNGDEADGLDEGFVMYDAAGATYGSARFLVRDDEFANWVNSLPTDRIITFIDACHSGGLQKSFSASRTKFYSNGELGVSKDMIGAGSDNMAGGIDRSSNGQPAVKGLVYAAAREDQAALETKDGGLFVTSFMTVLQSGSSNLSNVFERAKRIVQTESKHQQDPTAVGETWLGSQL